MNLGPLRVFMVVYAIDEWKATQYLALQHAVTGRWMLGAASVGENEALTARAAALAWELAGSSTMERPERLRFHEDAPADSLEPPFPEKWPGRRVPNYAFSIKAPMGHPVLGKTYSLHRWGKRDEIYPLLARAGDRYALDELHGKLTARL